MKNVYSTPYLFDKMSNKWSQRQIRENNPKGDRRKFPLGEWNIQIERAYQEMNMVKGERPHTQAYPANVSEF